MPLGELDLYDQGLVPLHPVVPVFDLKRHKRYWVHVLDLVPYEYDKTLDENLVIDPNLKEILSAISKSDGREFKDVVKNKTGGTSILLAGRPVLEKPLAPRYSAKQPVGHERNAIVCSFLQMLEYQTSVIFIQTDR